MRYRNLFLLIVGIGVAAGLVELVFRLSGSGYSMTQRSGPGQISLYAIGLIGVLWFAKSVAGVSPIAFAMGYARDWRRVLLGFAVMFALAFGAMLLMHVMLGYAGILRWRGWETLTPKIWERTAIAILVVIVLAITEELIFRGFVLRYLRWNSSRSATITAVLASALIFSSLHVIALQSAVNEPDYFPLLTGLFLLGVLLGTVYVVTGSLACSIGIHAGLLGFKVFQRRTDLIIYIPNWLFGIRTDGMDLRAGPAIWLILIVCTLLFVAFRLWLWPRFWVERAVVADKGAAVELGFRLEDDGQDGMRTARA